MNCVHCGKKLYPEAPFCPHCGKPNENRVALDRNVQAFDRSYQQTVDGVKNVVRRKNLFIGKIAVLIFMILLFIGSIFSHSLVGSAVYDARDKQIKENIDEIIAEENRYLDEEDYFGLMAYMENCRGMYKITNAAPEYYFVNNNVQNYCEAMERILNYRDEAVSDSPYDETLISRAKSIRSCLETFYEKSDPEKVDSWYGEQVRTDSVIKMKKNLEVMIQAYFDMPADVAESLSSLAEGERAVMLEKYIHP